MNYYFITTLVEDDDGGHWHREVVVKASTFEEAYNVLESKGIRFLYDAFKAYAFYESE